jgi:hypothetical protein
MHVTRSFKFCGIHTRALIVKIQAYALVGIFLNSIYLFSHSFNYYQLSRAVPGLRRLIIGISPRRLGLDPRPVHGGFVVKKMILG